MRINEKLKFQQMRHIKLYALVAGICLVSFSSQSLQNNILSVGNLQTEYLTNPIGLDTHSPRFSWILESSDRGIAQSAYQVIVSDQMEGTEELGDTLWNSGKVGSSKQTNAVYEGPELKSGQKYYWRVKVWNEDGASSSWSPVDSFQMGLLNKNDWEASWISNPDSTVSAPLFRKPFRTQKQIRSAYVYVTGAGYYELFLNGQKVGTHVLDPATTDFDKRILYATYNVKNMLKNGENVLGLMLGNGAWRILRDNNRYAWRGSFHSFGAPRGLVQLQINFEDGSQQIISSDSSWKTSAGPITYNNLYAGEDYDARLEQDGWNNVNFNDSSWNSAEEVDGTGGVLDSQVMPPIRVTQTIQPVQQTHPNDSTYLYDLGQNIPGWWRIRVQGSRGTVLRIRGAETLNDSLFPTHLKSGDQLSINNNYHKNVWTDYTLKGGGEEAYEPHFFYTGFRYIEVKVRGSGSINSLQVQGRMAHSDLKRNGHFESSDSLFNRIYRATIRSQRSNQFGYPSDCPTREKGGYLGDGQVVAESSLHDLYMPSFYEKWLNDMTDTQEENGRIPNTAPTLLGGYGGGIAWGSASVLIPWWMYEYYEDTNILESKYESMKKYLSYLHQLARTDSIPSEPYIINEFGSYWLSLGEWCAPGESTDPNNAVVSTAYWYIDSKTIANIAGVLGKSEDQRHYLALADSIKQAFNNKFFDDKTNFYGMDKPYETYLLLALNSGLVPEDHKQEVLNELIQDIMVTRKGHLGTGILGTKYLFPVLANANRQDVLQTVVGQKTYPGWGYWIENGATTLWEHWDGQGSHNHQMFGSVNEYFYEYLAGIRAPTDEGTSAGYSKILIKPYIPDGLQHAGATIQTIRGTVKSSWNHTDNGITLDVTLPPNSVGTVSIPVSNIEDANITESGHKIWDGQKFVKGDNGITDGKRDDKSISFDVTSGSYHFSF